MNPESLPSALEYFDAIQEKLSGREPVLFLDYDGTLTPIVSDPKEAVLSFEMQNTLRELASRCTTAIISGRDRKDVQSLVGLDELIYAGSHGFDITGPDGLEMQYEGGKKALLSLDEAEQALQKKLAEIAGAHIERKKFAIAVHYRNVADADVKPLMTITSDVAGMYSDLKLSPGKKIMELKPDISWDKGQALLWLLNELDLHTEATLPMYIGDDLTDEDALQVIQDDGIGLLVGNHEQETNAQYGLRDVKQVYDFLRWLNEVLRR